MDAHSKKTIDRILAPRAPRDLEWKTFLALWKDVAQEAKEESGDRLAVRMNGHRVVFRRPHDGIVSIQDIEDARHLLGSSPDLKGSGKLLVVAIDERRAKIYDFDLAQEKVTDSEHTVRDHDPRGHHMRTVERHTGNDDQLDLVHFFDDLAKKLAEDDAGRQFVVLGHGAGKSDAAGMFVKRLNDKHPELARCVAGVGDVDLSADGPPELEAAAQKIIRGGH